MRVDNGPHDIKACGINESCLQRHYKPTYRRVVRETYFSLGSLFSIKDEKWNLMLLSGKLFSESYMKVMKEETIKARTHVVTRFDPHSYTFSVEETMDHNESRPMGYYRVELHRGWWDCGKFQAFRMP